MNADKKHPAEIQHPTDFFSTRFPAIRATLENWWEHGEQRFPCILITTPPRPASEPIPDTDDLEKWWMDVDFIIEREIKLVESQRYFGQAVPYHYVDRSASAMAGVLGARMEFIDKETTWAYPSLQSIEQVAELALDQRNPWYQKLRRVTERCAAHAHNHHFIGLWPLEGIMDIVAALYGTENLLMDLIAKPQEVSRAMQHIKRLWIELFNEFQALIAQSGNPGGIGWAGIWAPGTTFPLQEDISYMISPSMFRQFILPHLMDQIDAMQCPFYHLDGIGALPHLEMLLKIPRLKVIQWVPGAGKENTGDPKWFPLYKQIQATGKNLVLQGMRPDQVEGVMKNLDHHGLLMETWCDTQDEAEALIAKVAKWTKD